MAIQVTIAEQNLWQCVGPGHEPTDGVADEADDFSPDQLGRTSARGRSCVFAWYSRSSSSVYESGEQIDHIDADFIHGITAFHDKKAGAVNFLGNLRSYFKEVFTF